MEILQITYILLGILMIALALPLRAEKIKPNIWYGFRVRATLEDPELWYAVNKHVALRMLWTGVAMIVSAVGLSFIPDLTVDAYALLCLAVFAVVFGVGVAQSVQYMRQWQAEDRGKIEGGHDSDRK